MRILGVAINICKDAEAGYSIWPLADPALNLGGYDYSAGPTDTVTVVADQRFDLPTDKQNEQMRRAVIQALAEAGVTFNEAEVGFVGPTPGVAIRNALQLAEPEIGSRNPWRE